MATIQLDSAEFKVFLTHWLWLRISLAGLKTEIIVNFIGQWKELAILDLLWVQAPIVCVATTYIIRLHWQYLDMRHKLTMLYICFHDILGLQRVLPATMPPSVASAPPALWWLAMPPWQKPQKLACRPPHNQWCRAWMATSADAQATPLSWMPARFGIPPHHPRLLMYYSDTKWLEMLL